MIPHHQFMSIKFDLAEIKKMLVEISRKLDEMIEERGITGMMKSSEISLKEIEDLKVRYR
jgi:division protein CdvB (Snf7/Vps24/ESCRT-III family)